jgi:hypothetical protein
VVSIEEKAREMLPKAMNLFFQLMGADQGNTITGPERLGGEDIDPSMIMTVRLVS